MNILIINWRDLGNPLYGGAEIHIEKIASYLSKDHNVYFLTSKYDNRDKYEKRGNITYIHIGHELTFNFSVMKNIKGIIKNVKPDIIIEDINKVPFFTPLFTNIPILVIIPHIFGKTIFSQTNFIFASYVYLMEKPIKNIFKRSYFEVISDSTKKDLIRRGIKRERIKVIECGIDRDYEHLHRIEKSLKPQITYIGRLKKYKSVQHLIRVLPQLRKKIPDIRLVIAGKGDYENALKELAEKLQVSQLVEFKGFVSEEEKWRILRQSWVSVYPSLIEGWGIVNIEANLMKTPVVCANVAGLKDSVKNGYSGLLYEYGDINNLCSTLCEIMENNEKMNEFSDNAYNWSKNFLWEQTGKRTEKLIKHIITYIVTNKKCPL